MPTRVDLYAHLLPEEFLEVSYDRHATPTMEGLREATHFWDVERRLSHMDEFGIDKQAIMLTQHNWPNLSPDEIHEVADVGNRGILEIAEEHPDRFIPVATIPRVDADAIEMVERYLDDWDMAGVQLFTNQLGTPIDDEAFEPLYELLADRGVPIWLHPQDHDWHDWTYEFALNKMLGWPWETSLAVARLVFGGVLERHPDLDVITHHSGGMIPFFAQRIATYYEKEDEDWVDLKEPVLSYFSRCYADTMIHGSVPSLECAADFFDDGHLVFGTDYPFGPGGGREYVRMTVEGIEGMDLPEEERTDVFGENALDILS